METRRWAALPVVLTATLLYGFDQNVVNIALPTLRTSLGAGPVALELVVGGYAFAYASGLVTGGRFGDLFGYRRVFLCGMAAFTVASLLAGLAPTALALVGTRLLQGLAAAVMVPQVLAFITAVFPPTERTTALAWFGITGGISGILGQVLGGLLLDADVAGLGWRALFLLNLPVGGLALAYAYRLLPRTTPPRRASLDPIGMIGLALGVGLILLPLTLGRLWIAVVAAIPVLAVTVLYEARRTDPIVDFTLFRNRTYLAGLGMAMAFLAFFASSFFVLSLFLQAGLGLSPLRAGLSFTPFSLVAMVTALRVRPADGPVRAGSGHLGGVRAERSGPGLVPDHAVIGGRVDSRRPHDRRRRQWHHHDGVSRRGFVHRATGPGWCRLGHPEHDPAVRRHSRPGGDRGRLLPHARVCS
jgi:MFS family permease